MQSSFIRFTSVFITDQNHTIQLHLEEDEFRMVPLEDFFMLY